MYRTPVEAIESATPMGGEIMMTGDALGLVKPGYLADLLPQCKANVNPCVQDVRFYTGQWRDTRQTIH